MTSRREPHVHEERVRYAETDQMGVAHHAVYVVWFEAARSSLLRARGSSYRAWEEQGYALPVSGVELRLTRGARYEDVVSVSVWVDRVQSRAVTFRYEVRKDGELLATGATEHVLVREGKPVRFPPELLAYLESA